MPGEEKNDVPGTGSTHLSFEEVFEAYRDGTMEQNVEGGDWQ